MKKYRFYASLVAIFACFCFSGCFSFTTPSERKFIKEVERLLMPVSDEVTVNTSVSCAIVSVPEKLELIRAYEKVRNQKPLLSDYNRYFTPSYGAEEDERNANNEYIGRTNYEEIYSKMSETERQEKRRAEYNKALRNWENSPRESAESCQNAIENYIKNLSNTKGIKLVDRSKIDEILKEHAFQASSLWASEKNMAEVGKVLNVQYLIYVTANPKSNYSNNISFECINVTTFQKVVLSGDYHSKEFSKKSIENLVNSAYENQVAKNNINGLWLCNGVMTNGVSYNNKISKYVSPFASGYELRKTSDFPKEYKLNVENAKLYVNSYEGRLQGKNINTNCEVSYLLAENNIFGPRVFGGASANYTEVVFEHFWDNIQLENKLTDSYAGELTIIPEDADFVISGKCYQNGNRIAVLLGPEEKKDPKYYYLVFTRLKE